MPPKPIPKRSQPVSGGGQRSTGPGTKGAAVGRGGAVNKGVVGTGRGAAPSSKKTTVSQPGGIKKGGARQQENIKGKVAVSGAVAKPVKPVWTEKDTMARRIQTFYRGYRCKKLLRTLQLKKKEYDDMMDKLEKEAFLHMVKLEQEKVAKETERAAEERRKRQEEVRRVKKFLEAAFDGDNEELESLLEEIDNVHSSAGDGVVARFQYKLVECTDANNNSPLSEAAAGGSPDTISFLVSQGAQTNSKGQYGRTPLYRAAFGGHAEAVKRLLELGADPRIHADDGAIPENIASGPTIESTLKEWNIEETELLLKKLEEESRKRKEKEEMVWKSEEDKLQAEIKAAEKEHSAKQRELSNAHQELNKRIYEHDKCVLTNNKPELTLQAVQDAEDHLERCKLHAQTAKEKLQQSKLKLRIKRKEFVADEVDEEDETKVDVSVRVKELDDVLMKDVGDKIAQSGKWPLIIDPGRQCATFLKYRDTNYFSAVNPRDMEPETIRMGLLGAVRYGKFMVLDLSDVEDLWPAVVEKFDQVQKGLLPSIMTREFIKEERYLKLVKKGDGDEYSSSMFLSARTHNFKLVILTQLTTPPADLLEQMYTIKIHVADPFAI